MDRRLKSLLMPQNMLVGTSLVQVPHLSGAASVPHVPVFPHLTHLLSVFDKIEKTAANYNQKKHNHVLTLVSLAKSPTPPASLVQTCLHLLLAFLFLHPPLPLFLPYL